MRVEITSLSANEDFSPTRTGLTDREHLELYDSDYKIAGKWARNQALRASTYPLRRASAGKGRTAYTNGEIDDFYRIGASAKDSRCRPLRNRSRRAGV